MAAILLAGLFAASVVLRWPYLNRPLSHNYEWVTAHTLITLDIWQTHPPHRTHFAPIYTYPYPADTHVRSLMSGLADDEGRYYYVSYPPFAFLLPHAVFSLAGISPGVLSLQLFNLFVHATTALLFYALLTGRRPASTTRTVDGPAIAGFAIYTLSAPNLWYHANVYFADILVQPFFLLTLLGIHRGVDPAPARRHLSIVAIGAFLATYTEWLGVFLVFGLCAGAFVFRPRDPGWRRLAVAGAAGCLAALTLTLVSYARIAGLEAFIDTSITRFAVRSGQDRGMLIDGSAYLQLAVHYGRAYFPQGMLLVVLGLASVTYRAKMSLERRLLAPLLLSTAAVVGHHVVFFEFTVIHEFALLKSSIPIGIAVTMLWDRLAAGDRASGSRMLRMFGAGCTAALLGLSIYLFHRHVITEDVEAFREVGLLLRQEASPDETVFLMTDPVLGGILVDDPEHAVVAPQVLYYAGRDVLAVRSIDEARQHLRTYGKTAGRVFTFGPERHLVDALRIEEPPPFSP
jgi:hypothetical protein